MKKNKKRKKTPRYVQEQYWSTTMMVDDEIVDRRNVWHFYYFAATTIVPLLEDFLDVAEFRIQEGFPRMSYRSRLPEEIVGADDFKEMISAINLLVRYNSEGGLIYGGREINFEGGDRITELTEALHLFAKLLPYLNGRHFNMSEERYEDAPSGRHCSFDELCNLDKEIARRILPTLQAFAAMSIFIPAYFKNMYSTYPLPYSTRTDNYDYSSLWDKALEEMIGSWGWILEREPSVTDEGWENVPENVFHGLHLFAEYLPEMQND